MTTLCISIPSMPTFDHTPRLGPTRISISTSLRLSRNGTNSGNEEVKQNATFIFKSKYFFPQTHWLQKVYGTVKVVYLVYLITCFDLLDLLIRLRIESRSRRQNVPKWTIKFVQTSKDSGPKST